MFLSSLALLLSCCLAVSTVTITTTERRAAALSSRPVADKPSSTLFLLTGYKPRPPPLLLPATGPKVAPKAAEVEADGDGEHAPVMAELPPKPLPQTMLPRNMTADALKPPLGAAQVAPPPRQLVDVDVCRYRTLYPFFVACIFVSLYLSEAYVCALRGVLLLLGNM